MPGVVVYGDASGHQQQTTGTSDYEMIREYFAVHSSMPVDYRAPKSNPAVRDRVNLMNRQAADRRRGRIGLLVDPQVQGIDQGLGTGVLTRRTRTQIDKDRDRMRTHLSDALGYLLWQECRRAGKIGRAERPI